MKVSGAAWWSSSALAVALGGHHPQLSQSWLLPAGDAVRLRGAVLLAAPLGDARLQGLLARQQRRGMAAVGSAGGAGRSQRCCSRASGWRKPAAAEPGCSCDTSCTRRRMRAAGTKRIDSTAGRRAPAGQQATRLPCNACGGCWWRSVAHLELEQLRLLCCHLSLQLLRVTRMLRDLLLLLLDHRILFLCRLERRSTSAAVT